MSAIGLDIGGANLKLAHSDGRCLSRPFPLWKQPDLLPDVLEQLLRELPPADTLAITMTGELADCFATKREGVRHILSSIQSVADNREVRVWCTSGEFLDPDFACEYPLLVAAANWHALASWAGQLVPNGCALLVDIGTTTTDIIPLEHGVPVSRGLTDLERLQYRELEYSGVARTPLFALAHSVPFRDGHCSLAAEVFATTLDLYLWNGHISADPQNLETANGQPATRDSTRDRLCRMLCADCEEISDDELDRICSFLEHVHIARIKGCVTHVAEQLPGSCETVILSGRGTFLAAQVLRDVPQLTAARTIPIGTMFDPQVAEAACAFAVARLADDR